MGIPSVEASKNELLIQEAEKQLDANPSDPKARYDLACRYLENKCHIVAMSLFKVVLEKVRHDSSVKIAKKDVKAKIKECSKHVEEQAKAISKVAKTSKFHGYIAKLGKGEVKKGLKEKLKKHSELLPVEASLIHLFTSAQDYSEVLNAYLRDDQPIVKDMLGGRKVSPKITVSFFKKTAPILKHCLKKMDSLQTLYPKKEDIKKRTVFRGMGATKALIEKMQKEMKFENRGFASTSRSMSTAIDFLPEKKYALTEEPVLFITEGKTGVPIHRLSNIESEKEVLFAPGSAFTISEIKKVTKEDAFAKKIHKFSSKFKHLWVVRMQEKIA